MGSSRTATATFGYLVRTQLGKYPDPQEAYGAVQPLDTIRLRAAIFGTGIDFDRDIAVTLRGGYDSSHATIIGVSTLRGTLTVLRGSVTVDNIVIE
jgi:hypothetical protein